MRIDKIFGARHRQHESGDLLQRAGYVRQHASGIYSYLTLGLSALRRIEAIVREEMDRTGAQEILMSPVCGRPVRAPPSPAAGPRGR